MRQRGLRAIQPKNYLPNTNDGRADRPSANLLARQALPIRPNGGFISPWSLIWVLAPGYRLGLGTHMRSKLVVRAPQARSQARC